MERADVLIEHAAELLTCRGAPGGARRGVRGAALARLEVVADGALAVRDGLIADVGTTADLRARWHADEVVDATGRLVSPAFVDPHSHLLHGGSRHDEWEARVLGRPWVGIARGIDRTVAATRAADDASLLARGLENLDEALLHGTTTIEAKSGYGLDRDTELRLLRLARALDHPVEVVTTYLGAHVVPHERAGDREGYLALVEELLPQAAELAEYCDVTCDPVGFTADECRRVARAAQAHGMRIRVHADQTGRAGGARLAVELEASSADHLEHADGGDLVELAASDTAGVLLPGVTFHLLQACDGVAAQVRRLVGADVLLALATDYNPGSCPAISMQAVMQLAARIYRLSYAEIWHMSTINAAHALDRGHDRGSLEPGKRADVLVWRVPEHGMVVNRFGGNLVADVMCGGRFVVRDGALARGESDAHIRS